MTVDAGNKGSQITVSGDKRVTGIGKILRKYKIDEFLFGDLAAKYLDCIKQFPFILVKDRTYEGIPLNFSLNSFLNNVIFKELDSISSII